jgi:drug/metabolite transporter (DMT)-like permease
VWWGLAFPLSKVVILHFPPVCFLALRAGLTLVMVFPFLRGIRGNTLKVLLATSFSMALPWAASSIGLKYLDASMVALFREVETLLLIIAGSLLFKERVNAWTFVGILCAFYGIYLLVDSPEIRADNAAGLLAMTITVSTYTVGAIMLRTLAVGAKQTMMWGQLFGLPQLLCYSFLLGEAPLDHVGSAPLWVYGAAALFSLTSFGTNALYNHLNKVHGFGKIMPFSMLTPVVAAFAGYLFLDETLATEAIFGGILILIGVGIATLLGPRHQEVVPV